MTIPKWAQPALNSTRLTFCRDLNIRKFDPGYKGYYGKNEKIWKNHNKFYFSSPVCPFLIKIGQNLAYRTRNNSYFSDFWFFGFLGFLGPRNPKNGIFSFFHNIPYSRHQICKYSNRDKKSAVRNWEVVEPILESSWPVLLCGRRRDPVIFFARPPPLPLDLPFIGSKSQTWK